MPAATLTPPTQTTSHENDRQALFELIRTLSFKQGHFILASGKPSNYYLDCRLTALHAQGADLIGRQLHQIIAPYHVDAVGGVLMGAAPLVTAVSLASVQAGHPIPGFLIRKEAKDHGAGKQVEGHVAPWMRVALVEDVVTTGGSLIKGIEALRREVPQIQIACVVGLVDRNAGGAEAFSQLGLPFECLYNVREFLAE